MHPARRDLLAWTAAGATASLPHVPAGAASIASPSALGVDAAQFGLRPGSGEDQSQTLQRAIDETARIGTPLALAPGTYRAGNLNLRTGTQLHGVRGATRILLSDGASLMTAKGAGHVTLSGLTLDGGNRPLPERRGLVQLESCDSLKIADCRMQGAGGNALVAVAVAGAVSDTTISDTAGAAIHALDSRGLVIARNRIEGAGDNGIQVWRSLPGDDGTLVIDNRVESIANRSGGSGQFGNGINVFRAANVTVRGNRISKCAFSAVRGNAASNIHVDGNVITEAGEVAIYAEFGFEGALITGNTVDGAAIGISATNFNEGGRLAIVQGNLIRNLLPKRPAGTDPSDAAGIGISVEADSTVTGNIVEQAPTAGIMLGWGRYLRDISVTGNLIRKAGIGIAVSVAPGAGTTLIAANIIAEASGGAIVGMARSRPVTGDLIGGAAQYAHLSISGNRLR
ncbi:MAG TPA: TIGR03808 family TAT-translocated repetitive protein [Xanthobacteraceae bacterium]